MQATVLYIIHIFHLDEVGIIKQWEHWLKTAITSTFVPKIRAWNVNYATWANGVMWPTGYALVVLRNQTYPRHEGEDVVFLVFYAVFGVLLFTFLRAAEPNGPGLQLLSPPTYTGQAVAAAERNKETYVIQSKHHTRYMLLNGLQLTVNSNSNTNISNSSPDYFQVYKQSRNCYECLWWHISYDQLEEMS